jgi:hypothetical protein
MNEPRSTVERDWYFHAMDQNFGPYTIEEFRELAGEGILLADTPVKKGEAGEWTVAKNVEGLPPPAELPVAPSISPWRRLKTWIFEAAKDAIS